jgi:hypothetical protein
VIGSLGAGRERSEKLLRRGVRMIPDTERLAGETTRYQHSIFAELT